MLHLRNNTIFNIYLFLYHLSKVVKMNSTLGQIIGMEIILKLAGDFSVCTRKSHDNFKNLQK